MLRRAKLCEVLVSPANPMQLEHLMTKNDVADVLGLHASSLMRLVARGEFPAPLRVGAQLRWRRQDVSAWIDRRCVGEREERLCRA